MMPASILDLLIGEGLSEASGPHGANMYAHIHIHTYLHAYIHTYTQGMMPASILDLLIGEGLSEASDPHGANMYRLMGTGLVVVALVMAVMYAASIAKRVLEEAELVRF